MKPLIFYSQNREDLIISAFFSDVKQGFYVDVGAYDPDEDSVTKLFYKQGWSGINIEPQTDKYLAFQAARKRDINLNIGISNKRGSLKLRKYQEAGLSTFSTKAKEQYSKEGDALTGSYKDVSVKVDTLASVLQNHKVGPINFLKVDVEGYEYEVLEGNDWKKFRPEVICIESNHIIKDWHQLLEGHDYSVVFYDGLNEYFLAKEAMFRLDKFKNDFPSLLVSAPILSSSWAKNISNLENQLEKVQASLDSHINANKELDKQVTVLENRLKQYDSISGSLLQLFKTMAKEIRGIFKRPRSKN